MPISGQNVGRDYSYQINTAQGQLVISSNFIQSVNISPDARITKFMPISGLINPLTFHEGHMIKMEIARTDNTIDNYWAVAEAAYYAGIDLPAGSILETITEVNGTISQYILRQVQLKVDDFGEIKGNEIVVIKMSGYGSRREQLA